MSKKVAGSITVDESWGPALKESGLQYTTIGNVDEALNCKADFFLIDARDPKWVNEIGRLKSKTSVPILSLVTEQINRQSLSELKSKGSEGCIGEQTPAEEVALRIKAMLGVKSSAAVKEARGAQRIWFQQRVKFSIFDKAYSAWSTTLSETGVFLHTPLTFPLYSNVHLKFSLWGEDQPFECGGVIVRQEVEGDVSGIGIMFQNLKGENIRTLQSFLEIYQ